MKKLLISLFLILNIINCSKKKNSANSPIPKASVTHQSAKLLSISVEPIERKIPIGIPQAFKAIGVYSGGLKKDITHSVSWSSADEKIAIFLSKPGVIKGESVGETIISASLKEISGTGKLTVSAKPLVDFKVSKPDKLDMVTSIPAQFTANGIMEDGTLVDLTMLSIWESSNYSKAILKTDLDSKGIVTGVGSGVATIKAFWPGFSDEITVKTTALSHITISSDTSIIGVGGKARLKAIANYEDHPPQDITQIASWTSNTGNKELSYFKLENTGEKKGVVTGEAHGSANAIASFANKCASKSIMVTGIAPTFIKSIGDYSITIPSNISIIENSNPEFTGFFYQGKTDNISGFIGLYDETDKSITNCVDFSNKVVNSISNSKYTASVITDIGSSTIGDKNGNCSESRNLSVTTISSMSVTQLSKLIVDAVGFKIGGFTVDINDISPKPSEKKIHSFKLRIQATYNSSGNELVGVGISYPGKSSLLYSLHDGTTTKMTGGTKIAKLDSYISSGPSKVDIVWVVDNSGSMSEEQTAVSANAKAFFSSLNNKGLDFRLGVLATGSRGKKSNSLNPEGEKAWELWGSGWTTASDGPLAFSNNIEAVKIDGSGKESGVFFAERALGATQNPRSFVLNGGTNNVKATVVPRTDVKLFFIMLSDEGDQYSYYSTTPFDTDSNIFVKNGYKVYSIIGLNSRTQQPGTCSGSGTSALDSNNSNTTYYKLASATGGSSGTICTNDYSSLLNGIAKEAASFTSQYLLTEIPVSSSIVVKVNGVIAPQSESDGWIYNSGSNSIVFSGSNIPATGASIEVSYIYNNPLKSENVNSNKMSACPKP